MVTPTEDVEYRNGTAGESRPVDEEMGEQPQGLLRDNRRSHGSPGAFTRTCDGLDKSGRRSDLRRDIR